MSTLEQLLNRTCLHDHTDEAAAVAMELEFAEGDEDEFDDAAFIMHMASSSSTTPRPGAVAGARTGSGASSSGMIAGAVAGAAVAGGSAMATGSAASSVTVIQLSLSAFWSLAPTLLSIFGSGSL